MIGKTISHYSIAEQLGGGGMGMVYRAQDTRLRRTVVLKFLHPHLSTDEDAKQRFMIEAQAASALDHANICTIYEIGETDEGQLFIVMAFYKGETLKERIEREPLSIEEAVDIAIQIAQGIEQAHEHGIIHRDIKPANLIITDRQVVKILDFGLAKLVGSMALTRDGSMMGTAAYISPEQARGEEVDTRTDLWSFGVILYEMLAGQRPFDSEYDQAIIYALLNTEPEPIRNLRPGLPDSLVQVVERLIVKDPDARYQWMAEVLGDLRSIARDLKTEEAFEKPKTAPTTPLFSLRTLVSAVALLAATILTILYIARWSGHDGPLPITSTGGLALVPTWSPEGTWIAYASDEAGNSDIWKKSVQGEESIRLTRSPVNETHPTWSPDGRMIAFASDAEGEGINVVPADGGDPWPLTSFGTNPTWSPQGDQIAFDWHGNIYIVPFPGGEPQLVVRGTSATPHTAWMPEGKRLVFWYRTKGDIYVISLDTGRSESLGLIPSGQDVAGITLSPDGSLLVFSRGAFGGNKDLWQVSLDPQTGRTVGDQYLLRETTTDDIQCMFSPDGSQLAFAARQRERYLIAYDLDTATGGIVGSPDRLTFRTDLSLYPSLSPDGRKVVWTSQEEGQGAIHVMDLETRDEQKVTRDSAQQVREVFGTFAPDGRQISFSTTRSGTYEIWRVPTVKSVGLQVTTTQHPYRDVGPFWSPKGDAIASYSNRSINWDIWTVKAAGQDTPHQLTHWDSNELYPTWSPDGQRIAFRTDREGSADLWIMDSDGNNPQPYVVHPSEEAWSAWSSDGRWFYYTSDRSGVFNVWVMPSEGGESRQVTHNLGQAQGLPEDALFTKFAVSSSQLIVPVETRRADIYLLENVN